MTKTPAEFLEELRGCLISEIKTFETNDETDTEEDILRTEGAKLTCELILKEIEQFQAEVNDANGK